MLNPLAKANEMQALQTQRRLKSLTCAAILILAVFASTTVLAQDTESPSQSSTIAEAVLTPKRIVFVGDSITYDGHFIKYLESAIRANGVPSPQLLNMGLQSETCCGLSEPAHPWPRPNVHERLERLLSQVKPDVLVACYGINDGIYHPFDEARFTAYQNGINRLIEKAEAAGAKVILVTPPPFDSLPMRNKELLKKVDAEEFSWNKIYENYDAEVIQPYADWIMSQAPRVAGCVDTHSFMSKHFETERAKDADYVLSKDGVHLNEEGHRLLAIPMIRALGLEEAKLLSTEANNLIGKRQHLLRDAWLSAVGHQRPAVKDGLPLEDAQQQAAELNKKIMAIGK